MAPTDPDTKLPTTPRPKVGDEVYVGTSLYMSHGADDFQGGLCKISKVEVGISAGKPEWFVSVEERPGHGYNYSILMESQDKWREQFGTSRGYPDPDNSPESNRWD